MARGDSIFGRVDVDWFEGEKTSQLTPAQRDFYLTGIWLLAVKIRRDVIPVHMSMISSMSHRCSISRNTVVRSLSKLDKLGLITINPDKSITVHGIKEIHKAITWKETAADFPKRSPNAERIDCQLDIDIDRREEGTSSSPNSSVLSTSLSSGNSDDQNPEVSQKGEQEPSRKEVTTIEQFQAARPSGPEEIHRLAFEVIDSLNLPDQIAAEVEGIVSGYPVAWTRDCIQTTRDKQLRIAEGTDKTGFTAGPLNYLAGALSRKYEQLRQGKG